MNQKTQLFYHSLTLEVGLKNNSYMDKNIEFIFEEYNSLCKIIVYLEKGEVNINFSPSFNMNKDVKRYLKYAQKKLRW